MLYTISLITAGAVIISGLYVIAHGNWHKFGLKFAGVCLSTMAGGWMLPANFIFGAGIFACPAGMAETSCMAIQIFFIVRNLAFIIFHVAVGRDAIVFKHRERRGTACQTNSSKPLHP